MSDPQNRQGNSKVYFIVQTQNGSKYRSKKGQYMIQQMTMAKGQVDIYCAADEGTGRWCGGHVGVERWEHAEDNSRTERDTC